MTKELGSLNKDGIAEVLKSEFGLKNSREVVDKVFDVIAEAVEQKREVKIHNFGKFYAKHRPERNGFNPAERKHIVIPESYVPAFGPYPKLTDRLR